MNIFNSVAMKQPQTSRFDLSHDVKLSFRMGQLVPTNLIEVLPGDKFDLSAENFLRFAPLVSPVMHKVNVTTHYFFVPTRLMWSGWEDFITNNDQLELPYVNVGQVSVGSIADYLGYPTGIYPQTQKVLIFPIIAYLRIWNEYYRDQNLQTLINIDLVAGDNTAAFLNYFTRVPLRRAWQHDYFTACLPFAQKGDSVQLPLTFQNDIPVEYARNTVSPPVSNARWVNAVTGAPASPSAWNNGVPQDANGNRLEWNPSVNYNVDIQSDAVDINTVRRAFRLQEWLEKNARGGTRYVENILSHFGIKSSDARLQRPEYIGGSKQNMIISEVLATAENTDAIVPVGNMAGHGISVGGGNRMNYRAEEHGYIMGIINVQPVTAYQDGMNRMFTRETNLDFAWPTFANIGEQEVKKKEVYALTTGTEGEETFGYIPRYSEYKYMNSRVCGDMRTSLDFWHLGRKFTNVQELNAEFIECNPSTRIFAVEDDVDHIYAHIFNNVSAVRKLPKFGIPTI